MLNAAIDAANKATDVDSVTIDLLADTKMDATAGISKKIILNGNGHQLNGQLAFRAESDGSKVQNVHFVFDKDTKFASGDWASNIRIEKADNVEITGNQFRMTKDAAKHAGKSIAVHVFPNGVSVSGTKITGNKFDIEYADGNFGIFLSNEINSGANTLTNTLVDNNTFVAHKDAATEAYFLVAYDKNSRQGVQEVTVTNNHIADGGDAKKGVLLGIWGGVDGMTLQGNTFGAGEIGVEFMQDTRWGNTLPSTDIDIKGNTFNTSTAVKDSGAFKAKDPSNQNWEKVPTSGNGIADGSLNYVEYEGNDANIFGPNTVPFQNRSLDNNSYGTVFYDVDGVTLLDWQVVENGEAPQDKKVGEKPGYASTWYTDAEGKNAYDFKSDASKDGLLKLYLKRTPIEYKVSYDLDGGVNAKENPATFTVESNEIELAAPTRDGYDFAGWVDKGGKKVEKIAAGTVGDIALKATWTKKAEPVANHTVTFVDGLGNKATQTVTDGGKAVAPVDPEHDGWEFVGWYTSEDFKDLYDFDTPVTGDLTLYGGWRKAGSDKVTEPEGEQKPDTQKPADKKADDKALPQTGDNSALPVAVVAGAGVAAIAAGAVVSKRRKQE